MEDMADFLCFNRVAPGIEGGADYREPNRTV